MSAATNGSALQGLFPVVPDHHFFLKRQMKRLVRKRNSSIGGVCSGISEYLNIDETVIRILFLIGIFTPFPMIFTYLLLWIVVPKETI